MTMKLFEYGLGIPVERPIIPDVRFDLNMRDADSVMSFRFDVHGIVELSSLLGIPNVVITNSRDRILGVEALCILLKRLRYPTIFYDMMATFGRSRGQLCRIFNHMVNLIYMQWRSTIYCNINIIRSRIARYASAIHNKGSPLTNVWAFPDGTKIESCRIDANSRGAAGLNLQKRIYSGHKRRHCLNFQGLTTPDGLCIHFFGPLEGSRHDVTLLRVSKLLEYFQTNSDVFDGYYIYGDPAYPVSKWIVSGYKGNNLDDRKKLFNASMSRVRQGVEWNFGRMKTLWGFITYKMHQKIMLSNVGAVVLVAMFLTNCNTCYNGGNQISSYFDMNPPSLREYLCKE
ncbi:hypothetical protein AeMF1_020523 [Aphanomyces euteiches]|nr:hypothetical protein AeMF1_020523 [Aphanomyces euteiches]